MLAIRQLAAGYAGGTVLRELDLDIQAGSVQALVGRNGVGKTTLVHTIAGLVRPYSGTIEVGGVPVAGRAAHRVARAGVGLVPQGRRVFASLTVAEHLKLAAGGRRPVHGGPVRWDIARVLSLLPRLAERLAHRGNQLSGGEQQMLAIARALLTQPRLLLLDEPCEGLSPDLAARIRQLVGSIARNGMAVLLVEQSVNHAAGVADQVAVLDRGRLVLNSPSREVLADPKPVEAALGGFAPAQPAGVSVPLQQNRVTDGRSAAGVAVPQPSSASPHRR